MGQGGSRVSVGQPGLYGFGLSVIRDECGGERPGDMRLVKPCVGSGSGRQPKAQREQLETPKKEPNKNKTGLKLM